jgi:hypothetical protein
MNTRIGFWLVIFLIVFISVFNTSSYSQTNGNLVVSPNGSIPQLAVDNNGNAHIVWTTYESESSSIQYSVVSSSGNKLIDSLQIGNSKYFDEPNISLGKENIIISWRAVIGGSESYIDGRFLDYKGNLDSVFGAFSSPGSASSSTPYSCELDKGKFLLAWSGEKTIDGKILSVDSVNVNTLNFVNLNQSSIKLLGPVILKAPGINKYSLVWLDDHTGETQLFTRIFNLDNTPVSEIITVSTDSLNDLFYYSAAMDSTGKFIVAWSGDKNNIWQIDKRLFDSSGNPITGCQKVNADSDKVNPYATVSVSFAKNVNSIIVWEALLNNHAKVYLNRYDPAGTLLGKTINFTPGQDTTNNVYVCASLKDDLIYMSWNQNNKVMLKIADFNKPEFVKR